MATPNPMISNGTCYYAQRQETDDVFIPCGNDVFGHKTCCQAGDKCVSSDACYNDKYGVTYLAGCSDPDYEDESCPQKPGRLSDSPWVGLVTCAGSNIWSPCSQHGNPSRIKSADPCTCNTDSPVVAFTDAPVLTDHGRLPRTLGGSVVWLPGFIPTSSTIPTSSSSTTSTTSSPSLTSSVAPPVTAPPSSTNSTSSPPPPTSPPPPPPSATAQTQPNTPSGLSPSAKAGVGAGVALGVLAILAVLASPFLIRRRQKRKAIQAHQPATTDDLNHPSEGKYAHWSPSTMSTGPNTARVSELDSKAARPWSMRTELEGSQKNSPSPGAMGAGEEEGKEGRRRVPGQGQVVGSQPQGLGVQQGQLVELQG